MARNLFGIVVAAVLAMFSAASAASAQSSELQIRTDKGGYLAGEVATVTVTGLNECSGRTVTAGLRDVTRGAKFATAEVTLDASGSGSVRVPLMSDNGGSPVQAAAWANCVDRGFEPDLALDPHPLLVSVSFLSAEDVAAFVPAGATEITRTVARGDIAGMLSALRPGDVIQTAYPGDGGPLPHDVAAGQLRSLLASGSGEDTFGVGRLGLLGSWEINGSYALLASYIQSGERHVVALGVGEVDGRWYITSYGNVALSTGILEQYALQHRVRLASIAPGAPETGNTSGSLNRGHPGPVIAVGVSLMLFVVVVAVVAHCPARGLARRRLR
ncbi:MAG: hypothetical protein AB7N24_16565 [Dehalococcoidia bacterium]